MTTWAPLAKSPNCASQTTSSFGAAVAKPYSKASTASSDSTESKQWNQPCFSWSC